MFPNFNRFPSLYEYVTFKEASLIIFSVGTCELQVDEFGNVRHNFVQDKLTFLNGKDIVIDQSNMVDMGDLYSIRFIKKDKPFKTLIEMNSPMVLILKKE